MCEMITTVPYRAKHRKCFLWYQFPPFSCRLRYVVYLPILVGTVPVPVGTVPIHASTIPVHVGIVQVHGTVPILVVPVPIGTVLVLVGAVPVPVGATPILASTIPILVVHVPTGTIPVPVGTVPVPTDTVPVPVDVVQVPIGIIPMSSVPEPGYAVPIPCSAILSFLGTASPTTVWSTVLVPSVVSDASTSFCGNDTHRCASGSPSLIVRNNTPTDRTSPTGLNTVSASCGTKCTEDNFEGVNFTLVLFH
ncbi:uncharacterized protein LOC131874412 [Cryptomeria japonica]|uniref:uncharacterized protein LOC131874412 n=1 Tax=Cryptomeria japonica TaxID=3369 RepID=UPI0027DA4D0A|nr:uncharacterized protein LOC131874412 [Cryptomeria japonica]